MGGVLALPAPDVDLWSSLPRMWARSGSACPGCGFDTKPAPRVGGVLAPPALDVGSVKTCPECGFSVDPAPNVVVQWWCWTGLPRMWGFCPKTYPECVVQCNPNLGLRENNLYFEV